MSIPFDSPCETPVSQPLNPIRKLNFEDDDTAATSNTVTNIPMAKPLSHLFLRKERKIQSDPFLECRPKKPFDFFDYDNDASPKPADRKESGSILIKSQSQPIQDKPPLGLISSISTPSADKRFLIKPGCKGESMKGKEKAESIIEDLVETDGEAPSKTEGHSEASCEKDMTSLVLDYASKLSLSTNKNVRDPDLNTIPPQTIARLLCETESSKYIIVDCRYGYEYEGGHIKGAILIESPEILEKIFFTHRELLQNPNYIEDLKKSVHETLAKINSYTTTPTTTATGDDTTNTTGLAMPWVIFHCEFSQKRGPRGFRHLRAKDREINQRNWPNLHFPEIYILDGGYSNFYPQFPEHCEGEYTKMLDKKFKKEYAQARDLEKKLWGKKDVIEIDQDV